MSKVARVLCREWWAVSRQMCVVALLALLSGTAGLGGLPQAGVAQAARLEGLRFEDTVVLSDRTLRLNGLGLRGVAWIKAFVAGLYLAAPTGDVGQALAMPGPKRLRLKMMLEAPSKEFSKAFAKGVSRNEADRVQLQLASRMSVFNQLVDDMGTLRKGDTIDLDYLPGVGMQLKLNNKRQGAAIEGEDFYRAILKIFIGDKPVDQRLKEGLLSGGSAS